MIDATIHATTGANILTWVAVGAAVASALVGLLSTIGFRVLKRTENETFRTTFPQLFKTILTRYMHRDN